MAARNWDFVELKPFAGRVPPMSLIAFVCIALRDVFQYLRPTVVCLSATLALLGNRSVHWRVTTPVLASLLYYVVLFGIFRLLEPRGHIIEYDNYKLFGPLRNRDQDWASVLRSAPACSAAHAPAASTATGEAVGSTPR